jgi:ABC-type multidrug transport system ATPase subunit
MRLCLTHCGCTCHTQEDTFTPTMTCQETLAFYAGVMLGGQQWSCHKSRAGRVEEVLAAVGLRHSKDTLVGLLLD